MRAPDHSLRRLVAEIAEHDPEDVASILAGLDAADRSRVRTLVDSYLGLDKTDAPEPFSGPARHDVVAGLSPWLAERLGATLPAGMTPRAHATLRTCAALEVDQPQTNRVPITPSLGERMLGLITRTRTTA